MLELRPTCENCKRALPADSPLARICSFECTFCAECVERVLFNVCPNCGGGFAPRPIRPAKSLDNSPASTKLVYRSLDPLLHAQFAAKIKDIPPEKR